MKKNMTQETLNQEQPQLDGREASALTGLVMRDALIRPDGRGGLVLVDHFDTRNEAQQAATDDGGMYLVAKAKILFSANGNIRRWTLCA